MADRLKDSFGPHVPERIGDANYPGRHEVEAIVNGDPRQIGSFDLVRGPVHPGERRSS